MIVGKFDIVQFLLGSFQVSQNIVAGNTVLTAQAVDHIQPGFDLLQLIGAVCQSVPGIPNTLGSVLHLIHQIRDPFMELTDALIVFADPGQRPLRNGQHGCRTVEIIGAIEILHRFVHGIGDLFGILQHFPPGFQYLILSGFQLCLFDLRDLITQGFHAAQLLALVHGHLIDLPAQVSDLLIFFRVFCPKCLVFRKIIQKYKMIRFVKQGGRIVLTVDIDQLDAQLAQDRHCDQRAIDTANILAV